ncbi:MAG: MarR family transcriptional regulator [Myxococcota bacterium]
MSPRSRSPLRPPGSVSISEVEAAKDDNLGQLLLKAARLYDAAARERVDLPGLGKPKPAHLRLFPHIPWEGIRLTTLAERVGGTKQAVKHAVDELVEQGVLKRTADPDDGRAKRVGFTARGRRALVQGLGVLGAMEGDLAGAIGKRRLRELKRTLAEIVDHFEGA